MIALVSRARVTAVAGTIAALAALGATAGVPRAAGIDTAYVEMAGDGAHIRAISSAECPAIVIDGTPRTMTVRAVPTTAHPNVVCDLRVPAGARSAGVGGRSLPLPRAPRRIAVIGDTGCRLKTGELQACNDPRAWPFPAIAQAVANARPDLIVHVGDYYYREIACPPDFGGCSGTPHGDVEAAWAADFFTPGAPMFAAAPLVLARGNHEDCSRGGTGWFRYLDTGAATTCTTYTAPFAVALDGLRLVVFDDASADDATPKPADVAALSTALAAARELAAGPTWLVLHRPPYGVTQRIDRDELVPINATMQAASTAASFTPFTAILAGHLHLFEMLDLDGRPPVIVNGMGGDRLDPLITATVAGTSIGGVRVTNFTSQTRFGYAMYERSRSGWAITVHAPDGTVYANCELTRSIRCL